MSASSEHPLPAAVSSKAASSKPPAPEAPVMDHEYDGIREYDNPLPRWWVWLWAGSFFFSVGYFFHYHISHNGTSVSDDYVQDMAAAREAEAKQSLAEPINEDSLGKLMQNPALMTDAKALFGLRCAPCHGANAQGLIGPNLTDKSWIHGAGKLTDIYTVVDEGVAAKGMPAWGRQLSPIELRKVVAFVGTLRGTNVPGKPAEGTAVP
ncbi:MAG TPA: cbb3-type cytochrome c oxidase N-terminal domain-containing protein [Polyangiaceae bacterium]|nr:cbb3-type cytochrome c oxidase N-terminal domain-containing protein [Polyangiaceae bacterium]